MSIFTGNREYLGIPPHTITGGTFHHVGNLVLRKWAGLVEVRGEFLDLGRLEQDDPRLTGSNHLELRLRGGERAGEFGDRRVPLARGDLGAEIALRARVAPFLPDGRMVTAGEDAGIGVPDGDQVRFLDQVNAENAVLGQTGAKVVAELIGEIPMQDRALPATVEAK